MELTQELIVNDLQKIKAVLSKVYGVTDIIIESVTTATKSTRLTAMTATRTPMAKSFTSMTTVTA
jgi:hypothetical protein